jgi:hypothetical protein
LLFCEKSYEEEACSIQEKLETVSTFLESVKQTNDRFGCSADRQWNDCIQEALDAASDTRRLTRNENEERNEIIQRYGIQIASELLSSVACAVALMCDNCDDAEDACANLALDSVINIISGTQYVLEKLCEGDNIENFVIAAKVVANVAEVNVDLLTGINL